jgi:hypothetical protein
MKGGKKWLKKEVKRRWRKGKVVKNTAVADGYL